MILEKIKKEIMLNNINEDILHISIYQLLKEPKYKEGFNSLRLMKLDDKYMLYSPICNFVPEAMQNVISEELIIDLEKEIIRKITSTEKETYQRYIRKEEKENLIKFKRMIKDTGSAKDLSKAVDEEVKINEKFIHDINRYILQYNPYDDDLYLLENIIILKKDYFKETSKMQNFNSAVYPMNVNYIGKSTINKDTKMNIADYLLSDNLLDDLIKKNEIDKVFLIGQKTKAEKYLTEKFNKKVADILLSNKLTKEEKYLLLIEENYQQVKQKIINEIDKLDSYNVIEEINLLNSVRTKKIVEKIKRLDLFNIKDISFEEINDVSQKNLCKKIIELTPSNFLNNIEYYLMFQGIDYGIGYFTEDTEMKSNYIIAKEGEDFIGYIKYTKENNLLKIDTLEVTKGYRNNKIGTLLLRELGNLAINENRVIYNTIYSVDGLSKLPKIKDRMNKESLSLFIDTDIRTASFNDSTIINEMLINYIKKIPNFDSLKFKESYMKVLIKIDKNNDLNYKEIFLMITENYETKKHMIKYKK